MATPALNFCSVFKIFLIFIMSASPGHRPPADRSGDTPYGGFIEKQNGMKFRLSEGFEVFEEFTASSNVPAAHIAFYKVDIEIISLSDICLIFFPSGP
jgi:hypothetical protein